MRYSNDDAGMIAMEIESTIHDPCMLSLVMPNEMATIKTTTWRAVLILSWVPNGTYPLFALFRDGEQSPYIWNYPSDVVTRRGARRRRSSGGPGGGCARMPVGTYLYLHAVGAGNPIAVPSLAR
jgi:hypothetical protein